MTTGNGFTTLILILCCAVTCRKSTASHLNIED